MMRRIGRLGLSSSAEQGLRYDLGHEEPTLPDLGVCVLAITMWLCS